MANVDMLTKAAFGQYGSTLLNSTDVLDLSGSSATMYVIAITILSSDTKFAALETLDGKIGAGISTVTAENDLDNATTGIGASDNGDDLATAYTFPAGLTIYGKWDKVDLGGGNAICYFAPKGY
tara:strand:+ start:122 stop:493 length:372 start_codon:yes stop_codon:yes gene_type:complete